MCHTMFVNCYSVWYYFGLIALLRIRYFDLCEFVILSELCGSCYGRLMLLCLSVDWFVFGTAYLRCDGLLTWRRLIEASFDLFLVLGRLTCVATAYWRGVGLLRRRLIDLFFGYIIVYSLK